MPNPKLLLVEGNDEKYTIPYFMDRFVEWGNTNEEWLVEIKQQGGIKELLKRSNFTTLAKTNGLKALGIILDADNEFETRWASVRALCRLVDPNFPGELPGDGLVHITRDNLRLGVWIMPDNQSSGMFEKFLGALSGQSPLWDFACAACLEASRHEGSFKPAHLDKAQLHTYLAWRNPPGKTPTESIRDHLLDAGTPLGRSFAAWMMNLFQLSPRPIST